MLVEDLWAGRLREVVREAAAAARPGLPDAEVAMIVWSEIEAGREAEAAIELAEAARGAALIDAPQRFADQAPA